MAGELHDNAESRSITPNGAESPRLVVSNNEMATFQGAQSKPGTTAVADREQAVFGQSGQGFSFSQFDNVYGKAAPDAGLQLAVRDDYLNRNEYKQDSQRKSDIPPGARPGIDYFAVSDFVQRKGVQDAANASPNLSRNLAEIQNCKWSGDIHVWQHHPAAEYDAKKSLIEVDPKDSYKRQIELFAHESYHATHQDLDKLYAGQKPVTESEYVNIKMRQEAGSFLRETLVNEDLTKNRPDLGTKPIEYMWVDPKNPTGEPRRQVINDLLVRNGDHVDEKKSLAVIEKFLREHPAAVRQSDGSGYERDKDGKLVSNDYVEQKRSGYAGYSNADNYARTKDHLRDKGYI